MASMKQLHSSFLPATWWNDQQMSQWRARPLLHKEIRTKAKCREGWTNMTQMERGVSGKRATCIIAVSEEEFCGGREFARLLAKRLGLRYVDAAILVERAAEWGGEREKLRAAIDSAPTLLDRFTRCRQIQTVLLRAALAEDIRDGHAVCYGIAADLLTLDASQILRVEIKASYSFRRLQVEERLKLHGPKAAQYLNKSDQNRRRWLAYLFGAKRKLPLGFDRVINLEQMGLDPAYAATVETMRDRNGFGAADLAPLESFAVSTRIEAALALHPETAHIDLNVDVDAGTAVVHGMVRRLDEIDAIKHVPLSIPASINVDYSQIELGSWDFMPSAFSSRTLRPHSIEEFIRSGFVMPRPAWIVVPALATLLLIVGGFWMRGHWFHPPYTHLLSVSGVITDSHCGVTHKFIQQTAECVRFCVKKEGAKYVLNDGAHVLVLSDQKLGEQFAGMRVIATGFVEKSSQSLQVHTIRAAAN